VSSELAYKVGWKLGQDEPTGVGTMDGYVGIDISKERLDVLLLHGEQRAGQQFTNTATGFSKLDGWQKRRLKPAQVHICLEATGPYGEAVADYLVAQGYTVSVVNPARIKGYAESQMQRNKTDKLDAALIADFCRTQQPAAWTPPPAEVRQLQQLVRHLDDLTQARQQAKNRLGLPGQSQPITDHLHAQITFLDQQIRETKRAITDLLDHYPDLKQQKDLLLSIPGLGELTIGKLIAECRDLRAFRDVRQLVAFAGSNPRHHVSGSSIHWKPSISRTGSASLRAALYMPALTAMRFNPVLRAFADRLRARGVTGKALVVAVMRKLLHLVFGVLKSGQPFDRIGRLPLDFQDGISIGPRTDC
jgi:transposase